MLDEGSSRHDEYISSASIVFSTSANLSSSLLCIKSLCVTVTSQCASLSVPPYSLVTTRAYSLSGM